ncbi:MAG: glycosyltransferase family 2 protein [Candidatus Bathyarchaeota archaeon]|nr:MAG: glycosyltransferase family 2 protein [Candidatus Bathyarchaeota archaeon]
MTVIIPAFNEEETIGEVVSKALRHVDDVIVVDDGSADDTSHLAEEAGAEVIRNDVNIGKRRNLLRGYRAAHGDIVVSLDADLQHDPDDIPRLVEPILSDWADLVIGARSQLPYFSERVIAWLTSLRVGVKDASSGYRAIRKSVVYGMEIHGSCTCGTFILEAHSRGARIAEVPIEVAERRTGARRIQTKHFIQALWVLYDLLRY